MIDFSILLAFFPIIQWCPFCSVDQPVTSSPASFEETRAVDDHPRQGQGIQGIGRHWELGWRYHLKSWWLDGWWWVDGWWLMVDEILNLLNRWSELNFLVNPPFDSKKKASAAFFVFFISPFKWPWDVMDGHGLRMASLSADRFCSHSGFSIGHGPTCWMNKHSMSLKCWPALPFTVSVRLHLHSRNKTSRSLFLVLRKPAVVIKTTRLAPFREIRYIQGSKGCLSHAVSLGTCFKPRRDSHSL